MRNILGSRINLVGWVLLITLSYTTPVANAEVGIAKHLLDNGLTVLIKPEKGSGLVAIVAVVRAGAAQESIQTAGIGNFVAQLLLAGTRQSSAEEVAAVADQVGGNIAAYRREDLTEIRAVTTSEMFSRAMSLIGECLTDAMFEDKWVEQVRTNILKHFSAESDNVFQDAYSKLRELLYEDSGYRRPVLGFERIVRKATAQDLKRFYASYYVPNNMIISIAGDVTPEQALDAVEKAFAGIAPARLPLDRGIADEMLVQPKYIAYESNTPAAYILLGWLAPPMRSSDYPAFAVAVNALGGGKGSLMYKEIRQKRGMAYDLGIFYPWLKYQSHVVAYVITDPYKEVLPNIKGPLVIDEIKQLVLQQVETLKQRKLTDAELQRAKGYTIGTFVRTQQHLVDRAYLPAWFEAIGVGYDAVQKLPDLFEKVTAEDVQRVAQKYFGNYAAVIAMPADRKAPAPAN